MQTFERLSLWFVLLYFFLNLQRKDDWVKKSSKSTKKQESRKFRYIMQVSDIKT